MPDTNVSCGNVVCAVNPGNRNPGRASSVFSHGNSRCLAPVRRNGVIAATTTTTTPTSTTTTTTTMLPWCGGKGAQCVGVGGDTACCNQNRGNLTGVCRRDDGQDFCVSVGQ